MNSDCPVLPQQYRNGWAQRPLRARMTVPPRLPDIVEHPAEGGALLFDPRTGKTLMLNDTAICVWRACNGRNTLADLVQSLTDAYDVGPDTASDHVDQLIALFFETDLLDSQGSGP